MQTERADRTASYIAITAREIADRIERSKLWEVDSQMSQRDLSHDVAWLARQVAKLAEIYANDA